MGLQTQIAPRVVAGAQPPALGESHREQLIGEIGEFLLRHDLAVTAENLLHAHAIATGADTHLAELVSRQECNGLPVTKAFLDRHARKLRQEDDEVEELRRLTLVLDRSVLQFSENTRSAQEAASTYGDQLQESVKAVAGSSVRARGSENLAADITRIAQKMLERTRAIELRMKEGEVEAAQLRENLEKARAEASIDPLTGLPNRRAFAEVFEEEFARAKKLREPLALAICDIDFFKRVNDSHGHETGDRVIRAVGQTLAAISNRCHVARHGGEEFVLLFCGQDIAEATRVLDQAREKLSQKRFVDRVTNAPIGCVTFSGGIADALAYEEIAEVLRAADGALYRAKETGRNRIERDQA